MNRVYTRRRYSAAWMIAGLAVLLVVAVVLSVGFGAVSVSLTRIWALVLDPTSAAPGDLTIIWQLRLPRTLLAATVGAALAVSGAGFQALFRNPLADPFVIGASSGAAFGAAVVIMLGFDLSVRWLSPVPGAAFAGAVGAVALVYLLAGFGRNASAGMLLLAGSALGTMLSAMVSFLMISGDQPWLQILNWMMGGFSGRSWLHCQVAMPPLLLTIAALWLLARPLDALVGGEEAARSLGLPIRRTRLAVVAFSSLATAVSVSVAGVIGFVGLIAPHIARLLMGGGHQRQIPASALLGALLMVCADALARSVLAPVEVPVGIVTALLGGPFFLFVLRTQGTRFA